MNTLFCCRLRPRASDLLLLGVARLLRKRPAPAILAIWCLAGGLTACPSQEDAGKQDSQGVEDLTVVVEADKSRIVQEEQNLQEKKRSVEEERDRLSRERSDIEKKLATISKQDKKQRDKLEAEQKRIDSEEKRMRDRFRNFEQERSALEQQKTQLLERLTQIAQGKGEGVGLQREESVVRREREVAQREAKLADKEREIARIESEAVKALQDITEILAALRGGTALRSMATTQTAPSPTSTGKPATKADVQKTQKQVRTTMDSKGILMADLPPAALELDKNSKNALAAKDYDAAQRDLTQLQQTVDGIKIDHTFVQMKMTRINRWAKDKYGKLEEKKRTKVEALLAEVSDSFSDGRYDKANRKINQIHSLLEAE